MKKLIPLLLVIGSFGLKGQVVPIEQLTNQLVIPTLTEYDSIAVSNDTGSSFMPVVTAVQHYFTNGKIDTLTIEQFGTPVIAYFGDRDSNRTVLTGIDVQGAQDSLDRTITYTNVAGRDSAVELFFYNGGFIKELELRFLYNSQGGLSLINIFVPGVGNVGSWQMYYDTQQNADSLYYTINNAQTGPGYYEYFYQAGSPGVLDKVERYEDINNDGEFDLVQRLLTFNNQNGEVNRIIDFRLDTNTLNLNLAGEVRYEIHSNSSISLNENPHDELAVYPNPASDILNVKGYEDNQEYLILSTSGQQLQKGVISKKLDLSKLDPGNYYLVLRGNSNDQTIPFIKK